MHRLPCTERLVPTPVGPVEAAVDGSPLLANFAGLVLLMAMLGANSTAEKKTAGQISVHLPPSTFGVRSPWSEINKLFHPRRRQNLSSWSVVDAGEKTAKTSWEHPRDKAVTPANFYENFEDLFLAASATVGPLSQCEVQGRNSLYLRSSIRRRTQCHHQDANICKASPRTASQSKLGIRNTDQSKNSRANSTCHYARDGSY